jgi:hypothetical protein
MPDDNSPQLGGQPSDNSPMISGRGTKIILSARGAYQARNLEGLVGLMTEEERKAHKRAVIGLTLDVFAEQVRQAIESGRVHLDGLYRDIERCLDDPTQDDLDRLIQRKQALNIHDELEFGLDYMILGVLELYAERRADYYNAIIWAFYSGAVMDEEVEQQFYHAVWHWQIESAWAILTNQSIPPFEDNITSGHNGGDQLDDIR